MDCQIIYLAKIHDSYKRTTEHVIKIGETNISVAEAGDGSLQFPSGVRIHTRMNITASGNHLSEIVLAINAAQVIKANTP